MAVKLGSANVCGITFTQNKEKPIKK